MVITGFHLSDRGSGGSVEHGVLTLLDRMQSRMADRAVGTMRTLYVKWPELEHAVYWKDCQNRFSSWEGRVFCSDPIEKVMLCSILSIARTRAITCSVVCCEKLVNARVVRRGSYRPVKKVSVI